MAGFDEAKLIERLRASDLDALGELYAWLGGAMLTLARSMLHDHDEANDVVEEALLRVRRAAPGFRGPRGLRTWTLRIVANLCRDALRRRRFSAGPPEDLDPHVAAGLSTTPVEGWDERMDQAVLLAALERAIAALPEEQREAVVLRDRMGLSYAEVAEALGISESAVKSRLFRARETLKLKLRALAG
jgi:RNA polymerase sigma-70 factor (ECF subfamily)